MSFDGSFKSARKVNLGGKLTAQFNRDLLLKQAQLERTAREQERVRVKSAIKIQASQLVPVAKYTV